jgi:hypothetical protein
MSEGRPPLKSLPDDLAQTHSNERNLFPSNVASLEPVRTAVAGKMSKMFLLKHIEDVLELYDCYDQTDESNYLDKVSNIRDIAEKSTTGIYLPILVTWGSLLLTRLNPLHLDNYINHFRKLAVVAASTWLVWTVCFSALNRSALRRFDEDKAIMDAKAHLHTHATHLTNYLKYPESDLI